MTLHKLLRTVCGCIAILGITIILLTPGAMDRETVSTLQGAGIMLAGLIMFGAGCKGAGVMV